MYSPRNPDSGAPKCRFVLFLLFLLLHDTRLAIITPVQFHVNYRTLSTTVIDRAATFAAVLSSASANILPLSCNSSIRSWEALGTFIHLSLFQHASRQLSVIPLLEHAPRPFPPRPLPSINSQ